jgi:hypothetical protein
LSTQYRRAGNVPNDVVYFSKGETTDRDLLGNTITVRPTYPAYRSSSSRMKSGKEWAEKPSYRYVNGKHVADPVKAEEIDGGDNFVDRFQIIRLEQRGNGGRAYKAVVGREALLVDLREESVMDIIAHDGMGPNGVVVGEFCWVVDGSEMKLMRRQSKLVQDVLNSLAEKATLTKVKMKDLKFGHLYQTKQGGKHLYLGAVGARDWVVPQTQYGSWNYTSGSRQTTVTPAQLRDPQQTHFKAHLWFEPRYFDHTDPNDRLHEYYTEQAKRNPQVKLKNDPVLEQVLASSSNYYQFSLTKSLPDRYLTGEMEDLGPYTDIAALLPELVTNLAGSNGELYLQLKDAVLL